MAKRRKAERKRSQPVAGARPGRGRLALLGLVVLLFSIGMVGLDRGWFDAFTRRGLRDLSAGPPGRENATRLLLDGDGEMNAVLWWDDVPRSVQERSLRYAGFSNIRKSDYAGSDACRQCHAANFENWYEHSHRRMNAIATEDGVLGDFSGLSGIDFMGVRGDFYRQDGAFRMRLSRGDSTRVFAIGRTIGSRFQQYYIGHQIEGPEPKDHPIWNQEHVLPFGWWMDRGWWIPVVHVGDDEVPDHRRDNPWDVDRYERYDLACTHCHNTEAFGDWLLRTEAMRRIAIHAPRPVHFFLSPYFEETRPELAGDLLYRPASVRQIFDITKEVLHEPAQEHMVAIGITCEACHLGSKAHVEDPEVLPVFYPSSENVYIGAEGRGDLFGRTPDNLNFTCSRCHSGPRPRYANKISTWNSTEFTDATLGHCYSPRGASRKREDMLTCVHCHDPHKTIGKKWQPEPSYDDRKCLDCHQQLEPAEARVAHTRHPMETEGARCMNCHMPRINEGMQDMVRTHTIFDPTDEKMIHANQPNACNMCHVDKPIDWTLRYLKEWYGRSYNENLIAQNYPEREKPVAIGWLRSDFQPNRLVAMDSLTRQNAEWALDDLLRILDDDHLMNRQLGQQNLERMLGISLDEFGYRFYMFPDEHKEPLARLRTALADRLDPGR